MNVKMKDIPENERPRERLINVGAENLSDEELLAIVLKTGTKNMSVKNLATFILSSLNGNNLNYSGTLINTLIFTVGMALLIWLLGISIIGFILILL